MSLHRNRLRVERSMNSSFRVLHDQLSDYSLTAALGAERLSSTVSGNEGGTDGADPVQLNVGAPMKLGSMAEQLAAEETELKSEGKLDAAVAAAAEPRVDALRGRAGEDNSEASAAKQLARRWTWKANATWIELQQYMDKKKVLVATKKEIAPNLAAAQQVLGEMPAFPLVQPPLMDELPPDEEPDWDEEAETPPDPSCCALPCMNRMMRFAVTWLRRSAARRLSPPVWRLSPVACCAAVDWEGGAARWPQSRRPN